MTGIRVICALLPGMMAVAAYAQDLPLDVPPIEIAMAISVGCATLEVDVTRLSDEDIGSDPNDLLGKGVSRAFIMRSAGIDLCVLGQTEIRKQSEIGQYLKTKG